MRRNITVALVCVAVLGLVAFQIRGARVKIARVKISVTKVYKDGSTIPEPENLESKIARIGIGKKGYTSSICEKLLDPSYDSSYFEH
jgi:hypothetical protein